MKISLVTIDYFFHNLWSCRQTVRMIMDSRNLWWRWKFFGIGLTGKFTLVKVRLGRTTSSKGFGVKVTGFSGVKVLE